MAFGLSSPACEQAAATARPARPDRYWRRKGGLFNLKTARGDSTLFMRADEIEAAWEFITPILRAWDENPPKNFPNYAAGTYGPHAAECLFHSPGGAWRAP